MLNKCVIVNRQCGVGNLNMYLNFEQGYVSRDIGHVVMKQTTLSCECDQSRRKHPQYTPAGRGRGLTLIRGLMLRMGKKFF